MDRSGPGERLVGEGRPHAHVHGLSDRAMPALAQSLAGRGLWVTGGGPASRDTQHHLQRVGVTVLPPATMRCLRSDTCLLVHGSTVRRDHPVRLSATRRGIPQATPESWLRWSMRGRCGAAFLGGREASVAAAMAGWVLTCAGKDPSVLLSFRSPQLGGWSRTGEGSPVVAELSGGPTALARVGAGLNVLLRLGADPWFDMAAWRVAYRRHREACPDGAKVFAYGHPSLVDESGAPRENPADDRDATSWVSFQPGSDWWGADLRLEPAQSRFRVFHQGRFVTEVVLGVLGRRNALGALTAVAVCAELGVSVRETREALREFAGLSRDFEARGSFRGVTLVDDAADDSAQVHHAVSLARGAFRRRRLWAVYAASGGVPDAEVSRLVAALAGAERVLLTHSEGAAEAEEAHAAALALSRGLASAGVPARALPDVSATLSELDRSLEPGDVLLTLGGGDVGTIADAFIRRLPRDRQGG